MAATSDVDLEDLKRDVRTWVEIDDSIRTLQAALRERKEAKRALSTRIIAFMANREIHDFSTRQGDKITFRVSVSHAPLSQQTIRSRLAETQAMSGEQIDQVLGNRERIERPTLRRTLPRLSID